MGHFAVSAVGADRPGIVAAVTGVLVDTGCNIEDSSMSILRGHFAMMLVVAGPDALDASQLEQALSAPARDLDLVLAVRAIDDDVPASPEGDEWTVSVYGADKPGIVHQVTRLLADNGVNVTDVTTRVIGEAERPVYAMLLDATLPPTVEAADVGRRLDELGRSLGVECAMHPSEADIL
ncbi:MAG TPA: ACT domain-containing protein [Acidimicrobiales bacterium]|nr:ACT domain-containing protein [Acidimicrobiales bacterium]